MHVNHFHMERPPSGRTACDNYEVRLLFKPLAVYSGQVVNCCCSLLLLTNRLRRYFRFFKMVWLPKPAQATMAEGSILNSDLPGYVLDGLFDNFGLETVSDNYVRNNIFCELSDKTVWQHEYFWSILGCQWW